MGKVIKLEEAIKLSNELHKHHKTIVLVGGCFDILHKGHKVFLEKAKEEGNYLFVALENDQNVTRLKVKGRPINQEQKRAEVLAGLDTVNYVFILPAFTTDDEYHQLTKSISPHVIAITEGDPNQQEKQKQADNVGAVVRTVTKRIKKYSTTKLVNKI